ncbi:MAG TPA: acyl-CoA thioesterase [Kofleriaceae bacterium]|nr:acyl-CoA thioesterase [Kofleriaceae bacterium]
MSERFSFPITADEADIDGLGHVSNLVYLRWVLEAATAHSTARGWDLDAYKQLGSVWVVRRHELDYLGQVTVGQSLVAETWVDSWKQVSCVRKTELVRDGQVVARCATTWAFLSLASGRPQRIPEQLLAAFQR